MQQFLATYGNWIFLGLVFVFMMRMHSGHGSAGHGGMGGSGMAHRQGDQTEEASGAGHDHGSMQSGSAKPAGESATGRQSVPVPRQTATAGAETNMKGPGSTVSR
jgi:hypothetical protein